MKKQSEQKFNKQHFACGAFVEHTAIIHPTASIGIGCVILGKTVVKEGATILPYCVLSDCTVGEDCTVGPFSHIRPGTVLFARSKVGAFVELKNSSIGEGSKVPHLSYVGDAQIGKNCNIGCGVVFCNYDGKNKHPSVVGDSCFIGSNCNLVAPITLGENCFTAAGSTITESMPSHSFAKARSKQETRPNKKT